MKVALAQINTTIGDFAGNAEKILTAYRRGQSLGLDLVVCPELAIPGYPPRDLLLKPGFVEGNLRGLETIAAATGQTGLLVGFAGRNDRLPGRETTNSVALLHQGRIIDVRHKTLLPTYDVFDEDRYFEPAESNSPVDFQGIRLGLTICEDVWNDEDFWRERRYRPNPAAELIRAGAQFLINVSASPWHLGKNRTRLAMLASLARKSRCPLAYCNLVGGNDELVFDGESLAFNADGQLLAQGHKFAEDFCVLDLKSSSVIEARSSSDEERLYEALVLGLKDYLWKGGFRKAIIGLSGGIDSALVACLAAAALGPENVHGISLPSQFSSQGSLDDARQLAVNLGIRYDVIPIQEAFVT